MNAAPDRVIVFDTTLHEGSLTPGATMSIAEKVELARALELLRVDVIEAGFPAVSPMDAAAVRAIARQVQSTVVCALARCANAEIDAAAAALSEAAQKRVHVYHPTSDIKLERALHLSRGDVLDRVSASVEHARTLFTDVEFSLEDIGRTDPEFAVDVARRAVEAGANVLNLADTVGHATPGQLGELVRRLAELAGPRIVIGVRCSDDLGLALANSIAAIEAGARQVECTVNGVGPRGGACALEELVLALRTRRDHFGLHTGVDPKRLYPTSRLVSGITGLAVQRNKAVVGENAFVHDAAVHPTPELRQVHETVKPEDVGFNRSSVILGKHTGRQALRQRIRELGYLLDEVQLSRVLRDFRQLASKKRELFDADVEAIVRGEVFSSPEQAWTLEAFHTSAGSGNLPTASVALVSPDGEKVQEASVGDGPVDAAFRALERATGITVRLRDYQVRSISYGKDAQGEAVLEGEHDGRLYRGRAVSTDIIEASLRAFLTVLNRIERESRPGPGADGLMAMAGKD